MIEELERRVRTLEQEAEGEKLVTRQVYEQSIRNGDYLLALRQEVASFQVNLLELTSRTDHIAADVVRGNSALVAHGRRLDVLTQDVREIRTELDGLRAEMNRRFDAVMEAIQSLASK